ncbi:MAG TPA: Ig-like domain-containing protein [Gemmatimonadales bacterium]|nr:Ig-like domain-containing protein [Gemmatimonadales bacterium]
MSYRTILVVGIACLAAACRAETYSDSTIPSGLQVVHGPPALVSLGTEMDTLLQVRVVDANGDPVGGVPVTWRITAGDGQLLPTGDSSGADGLAVARWKFGMIPGPKQVQVQISGVDPLTLAPRRTGSGRCR